MFRTLLRKEIVSHILSLRFGVTFILFILLVFASIYVTTQEYQRDKTLYAAVDRGAMDHLAEILKEEEGWRRARRLVDWEGRLDAVPVPPLSSVAQGLRPFMPIALNTTEDRTRNIGRGAEKNPLAGLFRVPDLVYVVSIVLSLLAILFAFDSVAGEKESGTLRLTFSNSVPRDQVLLTKWLGGYIVLIVPFLIAACGGLGYAWWRGALELSGENLHRLALLLVTACIYISVFFTLSLFISTVTHRATTALSICLLIWVVWILVIPNLAPVIAKIFSPTPSVEKIIAEKKAVDEETRLLMNRMQLTSGQVGYGKTAQEQREKLIREARRKKKRWDRFLEKATERQTSLAQTLGRISPSVSWTYAATALMASGHGAYVEFDRSRSRLRESMADFSADLRRRRNKTTEWPEIRADEVPYLRVTWPGFAKAARSALDDILILAVFNVVFFMAAFVTFLRYDVR